MILPSEYGSADDAPSGEPLFDPGTVFVLRDAQEQLTREEIHRALDRHIRGDWTDMRAEDQEAIRRAFREGGQLFAVYRSATFRRFFIVTEPDFSATTIILMPPEH